MNTTSFTIQSLVLPNWGPASYLRTKPGEGAEPTIFALWGRIFGILTVIALSTLVLTSSAFAAGGRKDPLFSDLPGLFPEQTSGNQSGAGKAVPSGTNATTITVTNGMEALDDAHKLAIGDRLSFRIVEDEEEPKPLFVTDSGDLEVPYIGRFPAVGKSCKELAVALKAEFEKEHYYRATVILAVDVMAKSRGKVYIVGPVRAPGPQEIPSDEVITLSKAILRAGGFSDFADKHNVKVTRKGNVGADKIYTINVAEILERGRTENDLPLEPGDLVYIPERLIRF